MIISIPERGSTNVPADKWETLCREDAFWELVHKKILTVEAGKNGYWKLKGGSYVGIANIAALELRFSEKFPGATESLLQAAMPRKDKLIGVPGIAGQEYETLTSLISSFLASVRRYLGGFKQFRYHDEKLIGTLAGGKLDVGKTIKLRIGGRGHKLAFSRSKVTTDLPYNQCIYAALKEIDQLSKLTTVSSHDLASARALRAPLADCLSEVASSPRSKLLATALDQAHVHATSRPELALPIMLASAILNVMPRKTVGKVTGDGSRAWFINLESLFELALRQTIGAAAGSGFVVASARKRPELFIPKIGRYRANPDVVIKTSSGSPLAIADAKYKDIGTWPDASDVHELLAHAAGYGVSTALIFYPSETGFSATRFGQSVTGCNVFAFGVSFSNFVDDVHRGLRISSLQLGSYEESPTLY